MTSGRAVVAALGLAAVLASSALGCRRTGTPGGRAEDRWLSTVTETPQPREWPLASYVESLAPGRELVRAYLRGAATADRTAMTDAFLPETRRSAETVIARDIELAKEGGPLAGDPTNMSSVFLFRDGLFPPGTDFRVEAEDETRLRELARVHEDATIVMARLPRAGWRPFFVVRDGRAWYLVP